MFYKDSAKCKPCHKAHSKAWSKANPEKKKQYNNTWLATQPQEYTKQKSKRWRMANPDKSSMQVYRRRDCLRTQKPIWADDEEIKNIYIEAKYLQLQVDHIVPLISPKVCGLHTEYNLQLLSKSDNSKKGNRIWPDM
jgi:5-methylcytosine-specific restriction endonuclease McrA